MKLISLSISNFGKLRDYDLTLTDGLNTVCEENGWGKSTLAAFLKAMFYGLPKSGKRKIDENDYLRYTPWQGGHFGGYLTFSCKKGVFRVERTFGENESFALFDTATGLPSSAFSESLGEELFGIDAEGFEQSVFLSARPLDPRSGNDTVRAKLTGIDEIHDMSFFEKAIEKLENRAKDYKKRGGGGLIGETEAKIAELKGQIADARAKLPRQEGLEEELAGKRSRIADLEKEQKELQSAAGRADRLKDLCARKEKIDELTRKKAEIEQRFPGEIPTREELTACRKRIEAAEQIRARLTAVGLNGEEQNEIVSLSTRFSGRAPSAETLAEKLRHATELRGEQTKLENELQLHRQALQTAEEQLAALPSLQELEQANALLNSEQVPAKAARKPQATVFLILSLLLFPAGLALLILGILQKNQPLLIAGIAALGSGVFAIACSLLFAWIQKRAGANQQSHVVSEVNRVLLRFGIPENQEPRAAIALLCARRSSAESTRADALAKCEELTGNLRLCQRKADDLRAFLAGYGIADQNPESGLLALTRLSERWEQLWKKQTAARETEAQCKVELAEIGEELARFFSRCPAPAPGDDERDRLETAEEFCKDLEMLSGSIAERKEELAAKLSENGIDIAALEAEPALAGIAERQSEIETTLAALEDEKSRIAAQLVKLNTETEQIPEWLEEKQRLEESLAEQKKRYELLCKTRDLLERAHGILNTKYLPATRRNFANYLALLCGKDVPKAELAANFDVTVLDEGLSRKMESYSRGWRDLLQFCVRLSLIDALYAEGEETPFLLLDDPFTNLDEERLAAAKDLLKKLAESRQILYLVCHADRA